MKIIKLIKGFCFLSVSFVLFSCSNLFNVKEDSEEAAGGLVISLGSTSGTRLIRPETPDLAEVKDWALTLTDEASASNVITLTSSDSSLSYDSSAQNITAVKVKAGTYTVELEGSYTAESDETVTLYGKTPGVKVYSDSTGKASVLLGFKKTAEGSFSLTLNNSDLSAGHCNEYFSSEGNAKVTLTSLDGETVYTGTPGSSEDLTVTVETDTVTVSGSSIKSGFYKLSFTVDSCYIYLEDNRDSLIEIADNLTTGGTYTVCCLTSVNYYATSSQSSLNGLSSSSRANTSVLLQRLAENTPSQAKINIYSDGVPELNIDDIAGLTALNSKRFTFYNADNEEVLNIETGRSSSSAEIEISGALTLTAGTAESLDNVILSPASSTALENIITLKGGACLNVKEFNNGNSIGIMTVTKDGTADNLASYSDTPFVKSAAEIETDRFVLYEYSAADEGVLSNYTVKRTAVEGTYSYCASKQGSSTLTAISYEKAAVKAACADGTCYDDELSDSVDGQIPFGNTEINFTLSFTDSDDKEIEITSYLWYLNGKELSSSSTASFTPASYAEADSLNISGTNVIDCFFIVNGVYYVCEYKFTFIAAETAAVYFNAVDSNIEMTADYSSSAVSTLTDFETTPAYCFDKLRNLYVPYFSGSQLTLTKFTMNVESGLYNTSGEMKEVSVSGLTLSSLVDISYDSLDNALYLLCMSDLNFIVIKLDLSSSSYTVSKYFTISSAIGDDGLVLFTDIAVNAGKDMFLASADTLPYLWKADISSALSGEEVTPEKLSSSPSSVLNYEYQDKTTAATVKDIQIGDGLGNDTESLYVLVRQSGDSFGTFGSNETPGNITLYSRGALVRVNTSTYGQTAYGWSEAGSKTDVKFTVSQSEYTAGFYPNASGDSAFYGPAHFAAACPNELVILDDGYKYDSSESKFYNYDHLYSFDTVTSELKQGAKVTASKPSASNFTWGD